MTGEHVGSKCDPTTEQCTCHYQSADRCKYHGPLMALEVPTANDYIDIVFDGPPGPTCGRFIEVENSAGASISAGEWVDRGEGLWALRIPKHSLEH